MSQPDRQLGALPSRASDLVGQDPHSTSTDSSWFAPKRALERPRALSARLVWRGLRRHWWQAFLFWAAGSLGLMSQVHQRVKPSFNVSSTIQVEPGSRGPGVDFETFKETQVQRITHPDVIDQAIRIHPELRQLSRLARSPDPEVEIRKSLDVMVVPRTDLIRVSMSGESATDAAEIVNAVIDSYRKTAVDPGEGEAVERLRKLREARDQRIAEVQRKREAVAQLTQRIGSVDTAQARDRNAVTIEAYQVLSRQLLQDDLELVEAEGRLDRLRNEPRRPALSGASGSEAEVAAQFYANPQVAEVQARLVQARDSWAQADRIARDPNDPSRVTAKARFDELQGKIDDLWVNMKPGLLQSTQRTVQREAAIRSAEVQVEALQTRMTRISQRLEKLNDQTRAAGSDELSREFARQDLERAEAVLETVARSLDQAEVQAKGPFARIRQQYRAKASSVPDSDHRPLLIAVAPLGILLMVLGLITLVELRSARVADPEEIPGRLRLNVLGVIPPLPRTDFDQRSTRAELRSRHDLNRFLLSLDHLRVAVCSSQATRPRRTRCLAITSASGSEGKTTLAAQLAERCANAGLLVLLIDADLRNPTLSRMLELSTARGLVNVLRGESSPEEAIVVLGGAGGIHVLPSGSIEADPTPLLNGNRFPILLARARETFDLVIVDSPPVLPVPDALTIGRSVDAAVLAVRFDKSRYPLVERAARRLASVDIKILGAVVCGVRGGDGSYDPLYGSTGEIHSPLEV